MNLLRSVVSVFAGYVNLSVLLYHVSWWLLFTLGSRCIDVWLTTCSTSSV